MLEIDTKQIIAGWPFHIYVKEDGTVWHAYYQMPDWDEQFVAEVSLPIVVYSLLRKLQNVPNEDEPSYEPCLAGAS